ncbi:MAG: hypothetical protein DRP02_12370 [Candidatus Gerdarchaeota archaeon]|nr:MAG: hypothetical protein DRP02_12370 [Candidatus Gerdarchaeota archaeon]
MSEKKCAICGSTKNLVLHHMDAVHGALLPDAVVCLCRACHNRVHRKHDMHFFALEEAYKKLQKIVNGNE